MGGLTRSIPRIMLLALFAESLLASRVVWDAMLLMIVFRTTTTTITTITIIITTTWHHHYVCRHCAASPLNVRTPALSAIYVYACSGLMVFNSITWITSKSKFLLFARQFNFYKQSELMLISRPVAKHPILMGQRELWRGQNRPTNARPEIIRKNSVLQRITKNE